MNQEPRSPNQEPRTRNFAFRTNNPPPSPPINQQPSTINQVPTTLNGQSSAATADLELEVRELFVRAAQLVGVPKSVGEIYGLLYLSKEPMSMDQIVERLKISVGSASQGLRQLRGFRAVRSVYIPGERKDFYVAEIEFRKLLAGFLNEEIQPHLESGRERIGRMKGLLQEIEEGEQKDHLEKKVLHLDRLHGLSGKFLPLLLRLARV